MTDIKVVPEQVIGGALAAPGHQVELSCLSKIWDLTGNCMPSISIEKFKLIKQMLLYQQGQPMLCSNSQT